MMEQTRGVKAQQLSKIKSGYCKSSKQSDQQAIPASWNLSELQRDFIESMFDKNKE